MVRSKARDACLEADEARPVVGAIGNPITHGRVASHCRISVQCATDYPVRSFDLDRTTIETCLRKAGTQT